MSDLKNSVWAKRIAQKERQKEFWLKVWDAIGVIALVACSIAVFFLLEGLGW